VPWAYRLTDVALKQLGKLDRQAQVEIVRFLDERIAGPENPERFGKPLRGDLRGRWRYRVGNYRIICKFERAQVSVLVLQVGHRSTVYD
jgi:mRNA interferase RelE/StbE